MKTKYALILATLLIFSGCGEQKEDGAKVESANIEKSSEVIEKQEVESLKDAGEHLMKEIGKITSDDLKKATPLSNEQLKALLPNTLDSMKRTAFSVGNMGMHTVDGIYKDGDKSITLSIMDGAGEVGSAMIGMIQMGINMGGERQDENGYMKPIEIDGQKGFEQQEKFDNDNGNRVKNSITLIVSERFMLMLTGTGVEADKLNELIKKENLVDKLKDLK
ncbi:MAG: hypothetical protein KU29_09165 [Sulfurovum sp. FS06-10]|nr:MAG: hypothetical protein KU29_09165 [Sulfurovum sp. FS06-10]